MAGKIYNPKYPGLYYFDTFTFTTLGTSGHRGPDPTKTYANAPWSEGFSIVDGQQQWTVPASGTYRIEAAGAYGAAPGRVVSGDVDLNEGQVVSLLVGQSPSPFGAGGGGGTFVTSGGKPLIVASGGDGTGGATASFLPSGAGTGDSGAGYYGNGSQTDSNFPFLVPSAYVNGGFGNSNVYTNSAGGFGGGQCPYGIGGGGYTGSPGNGVSGATCYADASVTNFTDLGATSNSAGYVTVSLIDPVPIKLEIKTIEPIVTKYFSNRNLTSILWSPEFNNFFAISDLKTVVYSSSDLQEWKGTDSPESRAIAWSPKLGLFTTGTATSTDGIHWSIHDTTKTFVFIIWCDFMNCFIAWNSDANFFWNPSYLWKSYDGIFWTEMTDGPSILHQNYNKIPITIGPSSFIVFSQALFGYASSYVYIYNGTTWTTLSIFNRPIQAVYYNNQFILFQSDGQCYVSSNGTQWSFKSTLPTSLPYTTSCAVLNNVLYICKSFFEDSFTTYSTDDIINWVQLPGSTTYYMYDITVANQIVFGLTNRFGKMIVSLDFQYWFPMSTTLFPGSEILYIDSAYSRETGYIVLVGNTNPANSTTIFYSSDGKLWNSKIIDSTLHDGGTVEWISAIGRFIINGYYLIDPLNDWETVTIPGRINNDRFFNHKWSPASKVLFCSNGDQTNDGYNWRNNPTADLNGFGWLYPNTVIAGNMFSYDGIRTSTDGGETWSIVVNQPYTYYAFGTNGIICMAISNSSVLLSSDGISWVTGILPINTFVACSIFWIDNIKSFVCVFMGGMNTGIINIMSTQDGNTWSEIYAYNDISIRTAVVFDNKLLIIPYSGNYTINITF